MAKTGFNRYTGKATNPANFYVDPNELSKEIKKSQKLKRCTNELAIMCQKIANNVIKWPRFRNKPQDIKDEMMSFAWFRFLKKGFMKLNVNKNPFSYITCSFYLNMLNRVMTLEKKAKQDIQFKNQLMEEIRCHFGSAIIDENEIDDFN